MILARLIICLSTALCVLAGSRERKQTSRAEIVARASRVRTAKRGTSSPGLVTPIVCGSNQPFYIRYSASFSSQHNKYAVVQNQASSSSSLELFGGAPNTASATPFYLDGECRLTDGYGRYLNSYYVNTSNKLYFDDANYYSNWWPAAYCQVGLSDRKLTCTVGGKSIFHLCPTIGDDATYIGQPGNLPRKCYEVTLTAVTPVETTTPTFE